jgi:rhamnosyltransferase
MNGNKLCGLVVLYEPDELISKRILSYLDWIEKLYIIDNSNFPNRSLNETISSNNKVRYIFNNQNVGMAVALNLAAANALSENFQWMLTMDQDSSFSKSAISAYIGWLSNYSKPEIAVVGLSYGPEDSAATHENITVSSVNKVITSGSIINLKIWDRLNGFEEKLFIDEVDHEYCYRAIRQGFKIYQLENIYLLHYMGQQVNSGYLGGISKRNRMIHSPLRIYYMTRNYCYVRRKYKKDFPVEIKTRDNEMLNILKNNLFFSGHFFKTLEMAVKGYIHYRKGIFGKYA